MSLSTTLLLGFLWACDSFRIDLATYNEFQIINSTKEKLTIEAFRGGRRLDSLILEKGETVSRFDFNGSRQRYSFFVTHPDSVVIFYGSKGILLQYCGGHQLIDNSIPECGETIPKNLGNMYLFANPQEVDRRIKGKKIQYRYSINFIDSDFQNLN
jgi:hypothetical protein